MQLFERKRDLRAWDGAEKKIEGHSGTIRGRVLVIGVEEVGSRDLQEAGGPPEKKPCSIKYNSELLLQGAEPRDGGILAFFSFNLKIINNK